MQTVKRKNGFILLLVVALIPLIGMVLAVLSINSQTLTLQTRRELLQVKAEQACLSGLAWVSQNSGAVHALRPEKPMDLTIEDDRGRIYCRIEQLSDAEGQGFLLIIGYAEDNRFSVNAAHRVPLSAIQ